MSRYCVGFVRKIYKRNPKNPNELACCINRDMDLSLIISKKIRHAIDLCIFLASRGHSCRITSVELSPKLGLSISTLENILKTLKSYNIIDSIKGPGGGFKITQHPSEISIWDVVAAFYVSNKIKYDRSDLVSDASLASYEIGLQEVVVETLSSFSLADFSCPEDPDPVGGVASTQPNPFRLMSPEPSFVPNAPNSVFELASFLGLKKV